MSDTETEIKRVQEAIRTTNSKKLKSDYGKYLNKLYKRRKREKGG